MEQATLLGLLEDALKNNFDQPALSNYKQEIYSFKDVFLRIKAVHRFYEQLELKTDDKVALFGRNDANWAVIYLATISYGAVIVPILADFHPDDVANIIEHSDSKVAFISDNFTDKINLESNKVLRDVLSIQRLTSLRNGVEIDLQIPEEEQGLDQVAFHPQPDDKLAVISYTSGTSGNSKGVMLTHKNIWSNARFGWDAKLDLGNGDTVVSFLPLAHAYGCLFEFLAPFMMGCHIVFLTKIPSPQIILTAFGELRPKLVLAVPLVIEKIFKRKIQPVIEKPLVKKLLKVPGIQTLIRRKINKSLTDAFGGRFIEVIIGGAAFNPEIERVFREIGFRLTIGYGMTECGPLISYSGWKQHRYGSAGYTVNRMKCRIDSEDPFNVPGEIQVKGNNVMAGYYKNSLATSETFTNDGWLKTGDLGIVDADDYVYIKGRNKSMILSANGQNIYPEEIENIINNSALVVESLVRENHGRLEAMVFPDYINSDLNPKELEDRILNLKIEWNKKLPAYSKIGTITLVKDEFEKTPKKSIKRYLYNIQE